MQTMKKNKPEVVADPTTLFSKEEALEDAAGFLKENCYTVTFETSKPKAVRKASNEEKQKMLKDDDDMADSDMVSISLKMLDSGNPYIKKMNSCIESITSYRDSMTIPELQLPLLTTGNTVNVGGETGEQKARKLLRKKPGVRIIMAGDVDEFDKYMTTILIPNLLKAVEEANENIDEIREETKEKLKKNFREDLFPEKFDVGIRGPEYGEVGVSTEFEKLCPSAAIRLKDRVQRHLMETAELAVADLANNMMELAEITAQQLACKTKFSPPSGGKYYHLKDGVLVGTKISADDPFNIPEGQRIITVKYMDGKKSVTEDFGPMTDVEYELLQPYSSEQRGKIYETTFDKLCGELERFQKWGSKLGEIGAPLSTIATDIRSVLIQGGGSLNAKKITDELKQSTFFRNTAAATIAAAADKLEDFISTMPIKPKARSRQISRKQS